MDQDRFGPDDEPDDDGLRLIGGDDDLPHWGDPSGASPAVGDDGDSWNALGSAPRWRGAAGDYDDADDIRHLAEVHEMPTAGYGDDLEFDPPMLPPDTDHDADEFGAVPVVRPGTGPHAKVGGPPRGRRGPGGGAPGGGAGAGGSDRNVPMAVATGVGLAVVAAIVLLIGEGLAVAFITILLVMAAAEFFNAVRRVSYHPATLVGLATVAALPAAVYWRGPAAYPIVLFLAMVAAVLWYLVGVSDERPVPNLAVTFFGIFYIGVLGSTAALLLSFPKGSGMLLAPIIATVGYDVGGWLVGRSAGRSPLSAASPNKTVEGLVGGAITAIALTVAVVGLGEIDPWGANNGSMSDAILLGIVVAIVAPIGDLAESMIKRDLGIKDMGTILPGHGGLLDRFDSLLFVLPAAYCAALVLDVGF